MNDEHKALLEKLKKLNALVLKQEQRLKMLEKHFIAQPPKPAAKTVTENKSKIKSLPLSRQHWKLLTVTLSKYALKIVGIPLILFAGFFFVRYAVEKEWINIFRVLLLALGENE